MENPIKMDDLGVPLFSETAIYQYKYSNLCYSTWTSWPLQQWLKPSEVDVRASIWRVRHVRMTSNKTASIRRCPPVLKKTLFYFVYQFFNGDRTPQTTCCRLIYYSAKHGSTKHEIFQPYGTFQSFTSPNGGWGCSVLVAAIICFAFLAQEIQDV